MINGSMEFFCVYMHAKYKKKISVTSHRYKGPLQKLK